MWDYAAQAIAGGLVRGDILLERVLDLPLSNSHREHVAAMLRGQVTSGT
jgi:hypothetical protein